MIDFIMNFQKYAFHKNLINIVLKNICKKVPLWKSCSNY
jgi:hypothetical protein